MVAIKASQAARLLAHVTPQTGAVLIYGPDAGAVAERGGALAKQLAEKVKPRGEILRLDDADLDSDPDRLGVELRTLPMFAGRNIVRASAGRRLNAELLKPIIADLPLDGFLIVEAGNLRRDEALRTLFEKAPHALAVPCYADEPRDVAALVREELSAARLAIAPEAEQLLVSRLGADRALSRREVEKLVLYAAGRDRIEAEDVEAIVGDTSEQALDKVALAAGAAQAPQAILACDRAVASGDSPQAVIAAIQRHFLRLDRLGALVAGGRSPEDAVRQLRPPVHFKLEAALARQCRLWPRGKALRALSLIAAAAKAARFAGPLEQTIAERLILDLSALVAETTKA